MYLQLTEEEQPVVVRKRQCTDNLCVSAPCSSTDCMQHPTQTLFNIYCSALIAWLLSSPGNGPRLPATGQVLERAELHRATAEDLHGGGLARVVDQCPQRVDADACTRGVPTFTCCGLLCHCQCIKEQARCGDHIVSSMQQAMHSSPASRLASASSLASKRAAICQEGTPSTRAAPTGRSSSSQMVWLLQAKRASSSAISFTSASAAPPLPAELAPRMYDLRRHPPSVALVQISLLCLAQPPAEPKPVHVRHAAHATLVCHCGLLGCGPWYQCKQPECAIATCNLIAYIMKPTHIGDRGCSKLRLAVCLCAHFEVLLSLI